jgi:galactitol PTS system EIIA component
MLPKLSLSENNIVFFKNSSSKLDVLSNLAQCLYSSGFVRESFLQAVQDRETIFPTGLPTEPYGVAIPHTDFEHVVSNSLAVGLLKDPVEFVEMGSSDGKLIKVNLVIMLAVAEKESIIPVLRKLITILKDHQLLNDILVTKNSGELFSLLMKEFEDLVSY